MELKYIELMFYNCVLFMHDECLTSSDKEISALGRID